jgi:hypothetical protein
MLIVSLLNSYRFVSLFPPAAVADILGDGDAAVLGPVAWNPPHKQGTGALLRFGAAARREEEEYPPWIFD